MRTTSPDLDRLLRAVEANAPNTSELVVMRAIGDACSAMLDEGMSRMRSANWFDDVVERASAALAAQARPQ